MRKRIWLALAMVAASIGLTPSFVRAASPPNIVLIVSDDQAWTDYGFMGHAHIETPNLDRLAADSVTFRRGYVPTALCRPSLMTLVTGHYAHRHGITGNSPSRNRAAFGGKLYTERRAALISYIKRFDTSPALLANRGYLSHQSGKWWEGSYKQGDFTHGMTRGFPNPGCRGGDDGWKIGREGMEPIVFSWPDKLKPADRDEIVSSIDIMPTILAAAVRSVPPDLPGLNLLENLETGTPIQREMIFGENFAHNIADIEDPEASLTFRWVIAGKWKLLLTYDGEVVRTSKEWDSRTGTGPQLFDLLADPHEKRNLAASHPDVVVRLAREIASWYPVTKRKTEETVSFGRQTSIR